MLLKASFKLMGTHLLSVKVKWPPPYEKETALKFTFIEFHAHNFSTTMSSVKCNRYEKQQLNWQKVKTAKINWSMKPMRDRQLFISSTQMKTFCFEARQFVIINSGGGRSKILRGTGTKNLGLRGLPPRKLIGFGPLVFCLWNFFLHFLIFL